MDEAEYQKRLKYFEDKYGPYIEVRGLKNWRNLFRWPTLNEWIILALLIMCIYFAFIGQANEQICQQAINFYNTHSGLSNLAPSIGLVAINITKEENISDEQR